MISQLLLDIPFSIMATGALVGIAASLLGTFLVLMRSSMLTDAISHSIVFGIVIVWMLTGQASGPVQIIGAALTGVLTVLLIEMLARTRRVKNDAAIGLVFPALFSIGVLLLNLFARDVHIDTHTVLLGEIGFVWLDTIQIGGTEAPLALVSMSVITAVNLLFVTLLYKELKLMAFDEGLARALGFMPALLFYLLLTLTSATAVAAFDAVGAVLFVAFVIVPPSAAYLVTDRLWRMILYGSVIAVVASVAGYYLAVLWNVSIGGMMALCTGAFLLLALLFGPRYGLIAQESRRRRQHAGIDRRALVVHLFNHEGRAGEEEENRVAALTEHLHWRATKVERIVHEAEDAGLIRVEAEKLNLTERGRGLAREVLEPWHREEGGLPA
ncbi:MAG TPA: metal ABC transporter permease [Trueperaceae bacterium]